ncbi:MAG: hypothetical protein IPM06_02520 [Rhizobiales bacterium]|nr:hypothetical protein [Hyphomicrobiales bacterium]
MEIFVREFDSRLLIALMAVEKGMEVVMGQKWLMEKNIEAMPPGLWIFKTMTLRDSKRMKRCKAAGHLVASIDEEVPAMAEGSGDLLWVSKDAVEACDAIFCLGEEHAKSLRTKWPQIADKLLLTGNPRWDYLRTELRSIYQKQGKEYYERYGPFILINTNSGETNSAKKSLDEIFRDYVKAGKIDPASKRDMEYWADYMAFEQANLDAISPLVRKLAKAFPEHKIIVRPHPAENPSTYRQQLDDVNSVHVVFEGSAAPWIAASDLLIHTYCTTGIEAFALSKDAICLSTGQSRMQSTLLSGRLNACGDGADDTVGRALDLVRDKLIGTKLRATQLPIFERFFSSTSGPLSAEIIVSSVMKHLNRTGMATNVDRWRPKWNYIPWWFTTHNADRIFPRSAFGDLQTRIEALASLLGLSPNIKVKSVGDRVVKLFQ